MKPIEQLTFTDDYMFGKVMKNEKICKGVIGDTSRPFCIQKLYCVSCKFPLRENLKKQIK